MQKYTWQETKECVTLVQQVISNLIQCTHHPWSVSVRPAAWALCRDCGPHGCGRAGGRHGCGRGGTTQTRRNLGVENELIQCFQYAFLQIKNEEILSLNFWMKCYFIYLFRFYGHGMSWKLVISCWILFTVSMITSKHFAQVFIQNYQCRETFFKTKYFSSQIFKRVTLINANLTMNSPRPWEWPWPPPWEWPWPETHA